MDAVVEIPIPIDAAAANALQTPERRAAAGRYLSSVLRGGGAQDLVARLISDIKTEAHANGLTDADVDAELAQWRSERRR